MKSICLIKQTKRSYWKISCKMSSNLENEDLENIPLVRMEDVQPARDRNCEVYCVKVANEMETCIVEDLEYDNEYIVDNDEDSNIGSMVSIHSEEVQEESDGAEIIVPEVLDTKCQIKSALNIQKYKEIKQENPESWPTLEILPGGVIKHSEKYDDDNTALYPDESELVSEIKNSENMYACAKCSQSFKFLFCLVKHVRWHEIEQKKQQLLPKLDSLEKKYVCLHTDKSKVISKSSKAHKRKVAILKPKKNS